MEQQQYPQQQGLYHPGFEHDACGIGMLVDIRGRKSHSLVSDAIVVLNRLTHRGGVGSEQDVGDGAGIMLQIPHGFFCAVAHTAGIALPEPGEYGVAMLFVSPEKEKQGQTLAHFRKVLEQEGLQVLLERPVPCNPVSIGRRAAEVCPAIYQVFIQKQPSAQTQPIEHMLYSASKIAKNTIRRLAKEADPYFYIASCSTATIVYKGMLLPRQLAAFYPDLQDERVESAIALVHSRFSTNTFPSWERAHPQRILVHNGEINTIHGNVNWMKARQKCMATGTRGEDFARLLPVIDEDGSDSAMLDDYIQMLVQAGYSLPRALAMAVPEPYEMDERMDEERRAFYEYHNCLAEPWDGPAALAFTDGVVCGALLDRNGLRPARYTVTQDGLLVLASETGVLDIVPERIKTMGRLLPGRMLLVDTQKGCIIDDAELKKQLAGENPYALWVQKGITALPKVKISSKSTQIESTPQAETDSAMGTALPLVQRQRMYGYTWEDLDITLRGMGEKAEDPVGAMGTDTPLAVLSRKPQALYNYFKQRFAQVTNPPIDAMREKNIISSSVLLGGGGSLLDADENACRFIKHPTPVLLPQELRILKNMDEEHFRSVELPIVFAPEVSVEKALEDIFSAADTAIAEGCNVLILSDAPASRNRVPIPALLAVSGLHQHLISKGTRIQCSIVAEAGDAWETHHLAALVSYGANAVCPYMAFETLMGLAAQSLLKVSAADACKNYLYAATKGIVKIMSKMGISTVRSYHGAQVFEALGIAPAVVYKYFTGTITRIGGLGLSQIEEEILQRHKKAFEAEAAAPLPAGGMYKWRKGEEIHLYNPESIFLLQQACRTGDYSLYKAYTENINRRNGQRNNIRAFLDISLVEKPLPLDGIEDEESIVRRFKTGAMSYGSISQEAHECMAIAMNRLGAKSNTGEGGENAERFIPEANGDSRCSAVKQVASGRFGVTIHYLNNAIEIQIKMAQGAKPGEGGHLPGKKVYPWIAANRYATPGVELISPPPHHDIYSIEDLDQLIHDLKNANPSARISVKLASEAGVGTVAVGVAKGLADVIVIAGYDGGTGAAPRTSIRHAGLPWELGVAEAHQTLLLNGLRSRVTLETDGKLMTGRDVVVAALLGAEEFAFATAPLVAMGCEMMRVCHLDTCPVGIATQNPALRRNFAGKPEYVENLMRFLARDVREWMSRIGVRSVAELVGRTDLLRQSAAEAGAKEQMLDLTPVLYRPVIDGDAKRYFTTPQQHHLELCMDEAVLLPLCAEAIDKQKPVQYHLRVTNQNRTVGCRLSGAITQKHGVKGLPEETVRLYFSGTGGQSFGAFATKGMLLHLTGDTNDYLGKGLCGGKIIVTQSRLLLDADDAHIVAGNVAFFGATSGEGYVCGQAGERFCVRNSGASVVVEGVGDHGCEYMTGGRVLILGPAGRNFAAGMSGGVAYLYNPKGDAAQWCNLEMAELHMPDSNDKKTIYTMLEQHIAYTGSPRAKSILQAFEQEIGHFVALIPRDYKRVMDVLQAYDIQLLPKEQRMLAAFYAVTK